MRLRPLRKQPTLIVSQTEASCPIVTKLGMQIMRRCMVPRTTSFIKIYRLEARPQPFLLTPSSRRRAYNFDDRLWANHLCESNEIWNTVFLYPRLQTVQFLSQLVDNERVHSDLKWRLRTADKPTTLTINCRRTTAVIVMKFLSQYLYIFHYPQFNLY